MALYLSEIVCEASNFEDSQDLETLAAAYAAIGQYDQACQYLREAIKKADPSSDRVKLMKERLLEYERLRSGALSK